MLLTADPRVFRRSYAARLQRIPHGQLFAAANTATILALYGHFEEAERVLETESWEGVPPLVQAQRLAALAAISYARGAVAEGLDHAVAATYQGSLDVAAPGAKTSELAFRTYRNLGLALSGRATDTTARELRSALSQLPLLGQIFAAWGLRQIAKSANDVGTYREMEAFLVNHAPHFKPVLERTAG